MTFRHIAKSIGAIGHCYQAGMQGLGTDSIRIEIDNTRKLCGSINLDECLKRQYPDTNRWDYILCYNTKIHFIEVHPATTNEIATMLNKLQWLKNWLKLIGKDLKNITHQSNPYHWIASGNVTILRNSPQARKLSKSGLPFPVEKLSLK